MAFATNGLAGLNLTDTYASAAATFGKPLPCAVGTEVMTSDGGAAILVKATSTIAQYDAVIIIQTSSAVGASIGAVPVTTTNALTSSRIAFAQTAITSSEYGWVFTSGSDIRVNCLIACQPAVPLFTTSTAGKLDDTTVTAGYCLGVTLLSSATSASAPPAVVGSAVIRTWAGG